MSGGDGRPLGSPLRGTEEGMGPRMREDNGGERDGRPRGSPLRGKEEGMGPRIREDTGGSVGE